MVIRKQPKSKKYRGSKTHGCGSMKKRRGAGNRGGRGKAGTGKKGNAKVPSIWKTKEFLGKSGFKKKGVVIGRNAIGIHMLEIQLDSLVKSGAAKVDKDSYLVDLNILKFDKLVSTGNVTKKMVITVAQASVKAIEKIKAAGGNVIIQSASISSKGTKQ